MYQHLNNPSLEDYILYQRIRYYANVADTRSEKLQSNAAA